MELINFFSYINLFSLFLFIGLLVFLFIQIYLLKKELFRSKTLTKIPNFKEGVKIEDISVKNYTNQVEDKKIYNKNRLINLAITLIVLIILGFYISFNFLNKKQVPIKSLNNEVKINYIASSGIKIYNENWEELSDEEINQLSPGSKIYIALEKTNLEDIDKARIRINRDIWLPEDVVSNFNKFKNVFYKEYIIASDESILRIEGQLHSKVDGWLGKN